MPKAKSKTTRTKKTKAKKTSGVSSEIKTLKNQVASMKKMIKQSNKNSLDNSVEELNEQLTKMISININLQSKMTELLIKVTDLIRENRELISLLEEASETEDVKKEEGESESMANLLIELRKITDNTLLMKDSFKDLNVYIRRAYTKGLLSKAIGGKIEIKEDEKTLPVPEKETPIISERSLNE